MSSLKNPTNSVELRSVSSESQQSNMDSAIVRIDRPSPRLSSFVPRMGKRFRGPMSSASLRLAESQDCSAGWRQDDYGCPISASIEPLLDISSVQMSSGTGLSTSRLIEMNILGELEEILKRNRRAEELLRDVVPRSSRIAFTPRMG